MKNQTLEEEENYIKMILLRLKEIYIKYVNSVFKIKRFAFGAIPTQPPLPLIADAAVEANKRLKKIEEDANFYKLVLLEDDIEEIQKLNEVSKYLRDPIPLYKVIWKYYYENPYNDLIGRVLGQNKHTGIYKITNQKDGLCYVGQAVDVAERWRQHIKRGLGAETPTRNKLYPAMKQLGVENFTFELIEECNTEKLNEREDFWQDYFHAKDFGYSIK